MITLCVSTSDLEPINGRTKWNHPTLLYQVFRVGRWRLSLTQIGLLNDHPFLPMRVFLEWPALPDLVPDLRPPEEETTSHTNWFRPRTLISNFLFRFGVFTLLFKGLTLPRFVSAFIMFIYKKIKKVRPFL